MAAVEALCTRCLLFSRGTLLDEGKPTDIIATYLVHAVDLAGTVDLANHPSREEGHQAWMTRFCIRDETGSPNPQVGLGKDLQFEITIHPHEPLRNARLAIRIFNSVGHRITTCHSEYQHPETLEIAGPTTLACTMIDCRLAPGRYCVDLQFDESTERLDYIKTAAAFDVVSRDVYGTGRSFPSQTALFYPHVAWRSIDAAERMSGSLS